MVVGGHFVESGPGALGVHRHIFKYWNAVGGAGQDFFDERRVELGLIARCFFGIVPGQQESAGFRAKMEAVGHIDDHGRGMGELVERLGGNQHTAQRLDGQGDVQHPRDAGCPGTSGIDYLLGGDWSTVCFNFEGALRTADGGDGRVLP